MAKKLRDVLPDEALSMEGRHQEFLDVEVIETFDAAERDWPSKARSVVRWWRLKNGWAVAENRDTHTGLSIYARTDPDSPGWFVLIPSPPGVTGWIVLSRHRSKSFAKKVARQEGGELFETTHEKRPPKNTRLSFEEVMQYEQVELDD